MANDVSTLYLQHACGIKAHSAACCPRLVSSLCLNLLLGLRSDPLTMQQGDEEAQVDSMRRELTCGFLLPTLTCQRPAGPA